MKSPDLLWNKILKLSLAVPGVRIDRKNFLRKELAPYCTREKLELAIRTSPAVAGIPAPVLNKIARKSIASHINMVTLMSFATGLPGGWWLAAAIPGDIIQYYYHVIVIVQKLVYLHGWPELTSKDGDLDKKTAGMLTLFIGAMMGSVKAGEALHSISIKLALRSMARLPEAELSKYALFNIAAQVAEWIGLKITKKNFAKHAVKIIPVAGGIVAGGLTYWSFRAMTAKLNRYLARLPLALPPAGLPEKMEIRKPEC